MYGILVYSLMRFN